MRKLRIVAKEVKVEDVPVKELVDEMEIDRKIFAFFRENPEPEDPKVHEFASTLGIDKHEFEGKIFKILGSFLGHGKSIGFKGTYDPEQLKAGIKVEMEHTNHPLVAEKITKDHLAEFGGGKYYIPYLRDMEKKIKEAFASAVSFIKGRRR